MEDVDAVLTIARSRVPRSTFVEIGNLVERGRSCALRNIEIVDESTLTWPEPQTPSSYCRYSKIDPTIRQVHLFVLLRSFA